jgi:tRNA/rRNA methyltransferase
LTETITISPDETGRPTPHAACGLSVGAIVHACHERTIDVALIELARPGLDRDSLEPLLTYCAELRCEADGATCAGCKRRTAADGIDSLDTFIARHREIVVGDGTVRLMGAGTATLRTPGLEALAKTWSGENYWFWARRVLRKLRYGLRRAHIQGEAFAGAGESPVVILMEPQLPDNIGMVARACANFGLDNLRLVAPRDGWPNEKARIAASGANYIIDDATAHETLVDAMGDLQFVVATTARQRDLRKAVLTPEQAIVEMRRRIALGERCGILFGRERNGLETHEVARADALVMIPVNSAFASLNLAQAVLLLGYEWMRTNPAATLGRVTTYERPVTSGINMGRDRRATKAEVVGLTAHLAQELDRLGFFNPDETHPMVLRTIETLFARAEPTEQEVRTFRGIVATLAKGKGVARKPST